MALFAILMCVNLASCSSSEDDPTEEPEEGGVVVSGKKLTRIVETSESGDYSATCTFSYDSEGRLVKAKEIEDEGGYKDTETYQVIWGDDAIKIISTYSESNSNYTDTETYTITLKNGLVQNCTDEYGTETFTYNNANRFVKGEDEYETTTAIWDGDKLVSISDNDGDCILTYGTSCKKGYFPFIAGMIEDGCEILHMAHPEIAGMRTNQLPTKITWIDNYESETSTLTYEFDKEGYISKIVGKETDSDGSTDTWTYTLTWE